MSTSATSLIFDLLGRDVSASATVAKFGAEVESTSGGAAAAFSKAATGITVAAAAAVAESIRMAGTFQSQMTRLVTAAGESESNLKAVSAGVLQVARDTGVSTTDLASGMYQIESAGFHGADGLNVLKAAAQGAQIEGANVTTVSNALTTALDDMHKPASDAATVMSQMVSAVGQGKMTMDDLAGSLHSVLPNATALGLSFPQVAGALAEMTSQGMSADQAAENLNHTIVSLAAPTATMTKAMASYGLSSADVAKSLGANGLTGTMEMVSTAILNHMGPAGTTLINSMNQSQAAANDLQVMLKSMPTSMATMASSFLNGSMSFSDFRAKVRGMGGVSNAMGTQFIALAQKAQGFNAQLSSGSNASQTYTAAMKGILGDQTNLQVGLHLTGAAAAGFSDKVSTIAAATTDASGNVNDWTTKQKTLNIQIAELTETVKTAGIELGTKMIPDVTAFVQLLTQHIAVVAKVVVGLVAFALAYKTVQVAIKVAHAAQATYNALMIVTKGIYMATQGAMLGFKAAMLGTQVLTEVQTASLERNAIAMGAYKAAQMASAAATWVFNAAQTALNFILDANPIILIIVALVALGVGLYEAYEHSKTFRDIVQAAFKDIKNIALDVVSALITAWNSVWSAISDAWTSVGKPIFDVMQDIFKIWVETTKVELLIIIVTWGLVWTALLAAWNSVGKPVFNAVTVAAQATWTALKYIFGLWLSQWKLLWSGLQAAWNAVGVPVLKAITDTFSAVWSTLQAGWNNVAVPVFDAYKQMWSDTWTAIKTIWNDVGSPTFDAITTATHAVGDALQWAYNNVIKPTGDLIGAVWSGISSGWRTMVGDLGAVGSAIKTPILAAMNAAIGIINEVIGGLNHISVTVPSWSPIDGGKTFGINLPIVPSIKMALGGTVKATPGGTLAVLGEAGRDETVVDAGLMNGVMASVLSSQRQQATAPVGQQPPIQVNLTMPLYYGNADQAAREILQALQRLKGSGVQTALG